MANWLGRMVSGRRFRYDNAKNIGYMLCSTKSSFSGACPVTFLACSFGLRLLSTAVLGCQQETSGFSKTLTNKKMEGEVTSIHTDHIKEVHDIPMDVLIRPFPSELDEEKVISLMETLESEQKDQVPPIDVLWVKGRLGGDYFYSFGGCHRHEAHRRLKRETVKARLVKTNIANIRTYLGSSMPDLK